VGRFEENEMKHGRSWRIALGIAAVAATLSPACGRRKAEVVDITPSITLSRTTAPLGSAIEVTYTWTTGPAFKKVDKDYRAFVHFLDSHKVVLFTDDHMPAPSTTAWEPGKTYSYKRTVFIPVYPYVGDVRVAMGLYPAVGKGERLNVKGEDLGLRAFKVANMEFQPQTENIFVVQKEGWHNPESHTENPSILHQWTKQEGVVSFKNPKKDVIVYLEADTCVKCFEPETPVLTVSANDKTGVTFPIENGEVFLKKIRIKAADLGTADYVDLKLAMNHSFVPKAIGMNADDRELGVNVYHLYVGEADKLGSIPEDGIVDAGPLTPAKAASKAPAKAASPKASQPTKAASPAAPAKKG
jgi:hypothetical protein